MQINHVQISIPKGEEDAAHDFYCQFLGLEEIPKPEPLRARGGFWMLAGGFQIHVGVEEENDRTRTSKAHIAYQVEDLEGWRDKLTARGIKVIDGIPIPGCTRFEFRDPFGNRVEFLEPSK